jgi:thiol-disulfide isomerase/thioredoxin
MAGPIPKKMKILKTYFLISCMAVITISARSQAIPNITDSRLDFSLPDIKGDSLRLSSMKGKVFLLDFWASWCGACRYSNKILSNYTVNTNKMVLKFSVFHWMITERLEEAVVKIRSPGSR